MARGRIAMIEFELNSMIEQPHDWSYISLLGLVCMAVVICLISWTHAIEIQMCALDHQTDVPPGCYNGFCVRQCGHKAWYSFSTPWCYTFGWEADRRAKCSKISDCTSCRCVSECGWWSSGFVNRYLDDEDFSQIAKLSHHIYMMRKACDRSNVPSSRGHGLLCNSRAHNKIPFLV